jgi:hypothetical protein
MLGSGIMSIFCGMASQIETTERLTVDRFCGLVVKNSWLQSQRSRVRFPALLDLLYSIGCGMGSIQPHDDKCGAT